METLIGTLEYKGYSIQEDPEKGRDVYSDPEKGYRLRLILYPTEQGIQHDYDGDSEGFRYCGNCKWADSIEEAKEIIDEITESQI
jgi:hypothetical protein